jgi:hypothetical protein
VQCWRSSAKGEGGRARPACAVLHCNLAWQAWVRNNTQCVSTHHIAPAVLRHPCTNRGVGDCSPGTTASLLLTPRPALHLLAPPGNDGTDMKATLPACCPAAISVSAIWTNALPQMSGAANSVDAPAGFSNYGGWPFRQHNPDALSGSACALPTARVRRNPPAGM